jgi:glyoxylase-like metal-dependent hydrolase (beta-lactamase superfamily II)
MPIEIDLSGLTVVVEAYIGHTDTDLIYRVPSQNVIYTGDLLTGGQYPVNINGYPTRWRATLAQFATFDRNTLFVPGHGQVMGQEGVAEIRSCFDDLAGQAENPTKLAYRWKKGRAVRRARRFKNYRRFRGGLHRPRTIEQLYAGGPQTGENPNYSPRSAGPAKPAPPAPPIASLRL